MPRLDVSMEKVEMTPEHIHEHTHHTYARWLPRLHQRFLAIRRAVPRSMLHPLLLLTFLTISCIWVLPTTFSALGATSTVKRKQFCAAWYDPISMPAWYNSGMSPSDTPVGASSFALAEGINVPAGVERNGELASLTCPEQKGNLSAPTAFKNSLLSRQQQFIDAIRIKNPASAAAWENELPTLADLSSTLSLTPSGSGIDPIAGKIAMNLVWQTIQTTPGVRGALKAATTTGQPKKFQMKYTLTCNGNTMTCSSLDACGVMAVKCDALLLPRDYKGPGVYPFDQYWFTVGIHASVTVKEYGVPNSTEVVIAPPVHLTYVTDTSQYKIIPDESPESRADIGMERNTAVYQFPPQYDNAIPEALDVQIVFNLKRTILIQAWAMFIVVMMWIMSSVNLLGTLDHVWLRPREVPLAMGVGAIGLVFAVPAQRNSIPGIPPIGIVLDVGSFFWCVLMVMISASLLMSAGYADYYYGRETRSKLKALYQKQQEERKLACEVGITAQVEKAD